jgi:hypothetical protein
MTTATLTSSTTIVTKISIEDIKTTYNGEQGCACGCGGDYFTPEENLTIATKRLAKINARLKSNPFDIEDGFSYFSLEGTTRSTRVYFKEGIRYDIMASGRITRTEKIEG